MSSPSAAPRQLRQRSSVSAHRPRPALTSSARGIAKLEARRRKELEANKAFSDANLLVSDTRSRQSQSSSVDSQCATSRPLMGNDVEKMSEASQGDFFASSSPHASETTGNLDAQELILPSGIASPLNAIESMTQTDKASAIGEERGIEGARSVDDMNVIQSEASNRKADQSEDQGDDFDEFDDLDDMEFLEALADEDLDWFEKPMSNGNNVRKGKRKADERDEESDFSIISFKRANGKPMPPVSAAALAKAQRLQLEFQDENFGHVDLISSTEEEDFADRRGEADVASALNPGLSSALGTRSPFLDVTNADAHPTNVSCTMGTQDLPSTEEKQRNRDVYYEQKPYKQVKQEKDGDEGQKGGVSSQTELYDHAGLPSSQKGPTSFEDSKSFAHSPFTPVSHPQRRRRLGVGRISTPGSASKVEQRQASHSTSLFEKVGRVSYGSTPQKQTAQVHQQFKTPFKSPAIREAQLASVQKHAPKENCSAFEGHSGMVFNLSHQVQRHSLAEALGRPESTSLDEVKQNLGHIFPDVNRILSDFWVARLYRFNQEDGSSVGVDEARAELAQAARRPPSSLSLAWTRNHYALILWKLAASVRHGLSSIDSWSWDEACRQLKYRYERETNHAHRSAIRRIQEHDSAVERPMVLCVCNMDHCADLEAPYVDLTDGWYRVQANIDAPLQRAAKKGLLKLGSKLHVAGAKLQGELEPMDPLNAYHSSFLRISGNSCKLARWDARLGFTKRFPLASARSLTADGGSVPCMDMVVLTVFPLAYVDKTPDSQAIVMSSPWGQQEEDEKQLLWSREHENAAERCKEVANASANKLNSLVCMLEDACQRLPNEFGENEWHGM